MEGVIYRYAYALLTLAHAKGSAELYLVADIILGNQILNLLYYLTRTLDVTGASDTNCNFKHNILPLLIHKYGSLMRTCRIKHCFLSELLVIDNADPAHKELALLFIALNQL